MKIRKSPLIIEVGLRERLPNIMRLMNILDLEYITENYRFLGNCPRRIIETHYLGNPKISVFPEEPAESLWLGNNMRRALKRGIIEMYVAYDEESEFGAYVPFHLSESFIKRAIYGLRGFPRELEIDFYLKPYKEKNGN